MFQNEINLQVNSIADLPVAAKKLIAFFGQYKIVLFEAPMGAGKTTLIKEICRCLGSNDLFSSPTYALVNEYASPHGKIFHFDLYRLKNTEELFDIGIEDYLAANNFCFVEWPEKLIEIIDSNYVQLEIKIDENIRYIRATKITI